MMGTWAFGVIMGLVSLIGLFMASRAVDGMFYTVGLLIFLFGVLFIFALIHRHTGHASQEEH
jgi:hypothetical protein